MKYEIWTNNGISIDFESSSNSLDAVLDEFCAEAGYANHADYCYQMGLASSPFNIREINHDRI